MVHRCLATAAALLLACLSSGSKPPEAPRTCGDLTCWRFDDATAAFRMLLEQKPQVMAIGEAHAPRGRASVPSATERFRTQLLPLAEGHASDIVLELLIADGRCKPTQDKVAAIQQPVLQQQAPQNQNQFMQLGHAAKKHGIRPHVLRPRCQDYQNIVDAGADGIPQMLSLIASLSETLLRQILARNARQPQERLILAYGGAMHNDLQPKPNREAWSFAPAIAHATQQRFLELDLIVPAFIKDNDSWRALPWYPHYQPQTDGDHHLLIQTGPHAYTLIFRRSPQ